MKNALTIEQKLAHALQSLHDLTRLVEELQSELVSTGAVNYAERKFTETNGKPALKNGEAYIDLYLSPSKTKSMYKGFLYTLDAEGEEVVLGVVLWESDPDRKFIYGGKIVDPESDSRNQESFGGCWIYDNPDNTGVSLVLNRSDGDVNYYGTLEKSNTPDYDVCALLTEQERPAKKKPSFNTNKLKAFTSAPDPVDTEVVEEKEEQRPNPLTTRRSLFSK